MILKNLCFHFIMMLTGSIVPLHVDLINILEPLAQQIPYCDDAEGHAEDNQPIRAY